VANYTRVLGSRKGADGTADHSLAVYQAAISDPLLKPDIDDRKQAITEVFLHLTANLFCLANDNETIRSFLTDNPRPDNPALEKLFGSQITKLTVQKIDKLKISGRFQLTDQHDYSGSKQEQPLGKFFTDHGVTVEMILQPAREMVDKLRQQKEKSRSKLTDRLSKDPAIRVFAATSYAFPHSTTSSSSSISMEQFKFMYLAVYESLRAKYLNPKLYRSCRFFIQIRDNIRYILSQYSISRDTPIPRFYEFPSTLVLKKSDTSTYNESEPASFLDLAGEPHLFDQITHTVKAQDSREIIEKEKLRLFTFLRNFSGFALPVDGKSLTDPRCVQLCEVLFEVIYQFAFLSLHINSNYYFQIASQNLEIRYFPNVVTGNFRCGQFLDSMRDKNKKKLSIAKHPVDSWKNAADHGYIFSVCTPSTYFLSITNKSSLEGFTEFKGTSLV
jgi:hypothetical protein